MSADRRVEWRSLEARAGDARARAFLDREFPEGAAEAPEGVSRRTMLQLLGASLSLAGLAACRRPVEEIVPFAQAPEGFVPGVPRRYATTLPRGLESIGLIVQSHEGRPTKIEGNPSHPASLGATDARAQAAILDLYDPDRAAAPSHGGERRSWTEFVAAWAELETRHLADGGAGLVVLGEPFASPTLARLRARFLERFPAARWIAWEPSGEETALAGIAAACGLPRRPVLQLARARVVVALDADPLHTECDAIRGARGFADGRRVVAPGDAMSRLYAVEAVFSTTGANADHRLALPSREVAGFVAALGAALRDRGVSVALPAALVAAPRPQGAETWVEAVAVDLLAQRGAGLILAGNRQPPAVHAAVFALNAALGNAGSTVAYAPLLDTLVADTGELVDLVPAMREGRVSTLVTIGGNPSYDAPADLEFAAALDAVENVVRLSDRLDESAHANAWHLPRAHFLECWSDARAIDGTPSVVQPLIAPLFEARSDLELAGLLATGVDRPGHDLVRETWSALLPSDFERGWFATLRDGLFSGGAVPLDAPAPLDPIDLPLPAAAAEGHELVFVTSPAVHDGRAANNGWLQELPDAITKLTWDNAALMAPATAREFGAVNERIVQLDYRGRSVEMPAWIVPGMAPGVVAVALGYGRSRCGRIGDGVGADVYRLRTTDALHFGAGLALATVAGTHELAQTQDHGSMTEPDMPMRPGRERPIVLEATLAEFNANPTFASERVKMPAERSLWAEHDYTEPPQWAMTIDLNACTGCNACVLACQSENNVPVVGRDQVRKGREMHWLRVDRYFRGEPDATDTAVAFQPVPCMHCENAPCEQVCPVAATVHDDEGLNTMIYNRCIGTRYCSNNCPYKVRRFNFFDYTGGAPEITKAAANPDVTIRSRGVMEKCTYCTQRIQAAKIDAKLADRPLADGDVTPACAQACPTRAIVFGDVTDPESRVVAAKSQPRNYILLEELYTKPRTTFLARLRNPNPRLEAQS